MTPTSEILSGSMKLTLLDIDSDINALILDYLTTEGYPSAAEKFSSEANLRPHQEQWSIQMRNEISHSIHLGDIQSAIESLNELNPQILDSDSSLHFALLRLQLVELIRECNSNNARSGDDGLGDADITPALTFATTQLAPRAPTRPEFLEDLERTMALLLFPRGQLEPQLARLLHPDLRREVADRVNKAILARENQRRDAAIRNLVRLRAWTEGAAREKKVGGLPERIGLGLDADSLGGVGDGGTGGREGEEQGDDNEAMVL